MKDIRPARRRWRPGGGPTLGGRRLRRRCGRGRAQHDWQSAGPGWLGKPQNLEIGIFPSEPLGQKIEDGGGIYDMETIVTTPERLAEVVNQRPSEWTIGVYDKPAQKSQRHS
ncbi:hypothetical protein ACIBP6_07615 [Nonomuraea terrae]|uniref:hypothetical protein n=1 Tax=Nonomuraea terrae TaxID=2530383 RepID=UPI0037A16623